MGLAHVILAAQMGFLRDWQPARSQAGQLVGETHAELTCRVGELTNRQGAAGWRANAALRW